MPSVSALSALKSKLKHRVSRTGRPENRSDATGDPKKTAGHARILVTPKPPFTAQAQSTSAPATGQRRAANTSHKPQFKIPTKIALKPVAVAQSERNITNHNGKVTGAALKPPTASKPILAAKPNPIQKPALKPGIARAAQHKRQVDNEMTAVLSRLKPVGTKK